MHNPYAPPQAPPDGTALPSFVAAPSSQSFEEARRALDQHLANPANVEADRRTRGSALAVRRVLGVVFFGGMFLAGLVLAIVGGDEAIGAGMLLMLLGFVLLLVVAIQMVRVLLLPPRDVPGDPASTAKAWYQTMGGLSWPYAWSCLAPTARATTVPAPVLPPIAMGTGHFALATPKGVEAYAKVSVFTGGMQQRGVKVLRHSVRHQEGDVAAVDLELEFVSIPIFALYLGILGMLLLRKRQRVVVTKWLLQGRDRAWYLVDGRVVENA
ncbi:MAG: hypothetical protein U0169_21795 [Polyangiaceae bacterium]